MRTIHRFYERARPWRCPIMHTSRQIGLRRGDLPCEFRGKRSRPKCNPGGSRSWRREQRPSRPGAGNGAAPWLPTKCRGHAFSAEPIKGFASRQGPLRDSSETSANVRPTAPSQNSWDCCDIVEVVGHLACRISWALGPQLLSRARIPTSHRCQTAPARDLPCRVERCTTNRHRHVFRPVG